jgi:hypothetical protein
LTHTNPYPRLALKALLCIGFVIVLLGFNAYEASAQNTKGDRPETRSGGKRETRFKSSRKKNKTKSSYNRVKPRRYSPASSARLSKPTKANRNFYKAPQNNRSVSNKSSRQNTRSSSSNNRSVSGQTSKQNTRRSPANSRSVSGQVSKQNTRSGGRVTPRTSSGRANFYSQRKFINNRSTAQSRSSRSNIVSNRSQIARSKRFGTKQNPPSAKGTVSPRSASRPFNSRKSTTPFAGFWNRKPKGEKPYTKGDLAGNPIRTKNFETRKPVLTNPTAHPYRVKQKKGDRPYKGPMLGGYVSKSTSGKPWKGDIAGRKIKGKNYSSKRPPIGSKPISHPRSISGRAGSNKGTYSGGGYRSMSGKMKRGGGTSNARSLGKGSWNNNGRAISGRNAGANGNLGNYSGNMKPRRGYSPQGETYTGNIKARKGYSPQGETYTGSMKARRRAKGGGSISGSGWNNNGRAIAGRNAGANGNIGFYSGNIKPRRGYSPQGETYTGSMKARKREKGGGSISGSWNNNGQAIAGRNAGANGKIGFYSGNMKPRRGYSPQGETYTGNIKAKKREKGGGSVSGKFWNNNEQSTTARNSNSTKMAAFQGNIKGKKSEKKDVNYFPGKHKQFDLRPSMRNQGEEYTGDIKQSRFKKNHVKSPHQSDEALKKDRPDKTTYLVNGLQIKVKEKDYKKKPNAADGSMPGIGPGKNSIRASEYTRVVRQRWDYKHNPSSSNDALKTREPGKAFVTATSYQGNIKMKRFDFFRKKDLYPDSRFVKTNKNNTDEERSILTNFKLWWARLFKKNESQPDHLKDKTKKPRYDKGEQGLWYD